MEILHPSLDLLPAYMGALERGWSPNNEREREAALEEMDAIRADATAFLASIDKPEGGGPPVNMPDGSQVPRLPGLRRWIWDGEFCGSIGLRWQQGTVELPPYCLGHIGYSVVPWKRRLGYASRALGLMLEEARRIALPYVEITTDPDNLASQAVILANGGVLHEHFIKPAQFGNKPGLRFRIALN